jgi:hypothetical protein
VAWSIHSLARLAQWFAGGLLVLSCTGGQTGDGGTPGGGGDPCTVIETREVRREEAKELGFDVESTTAAVFGESDELDLEFLLEATPALWVDRGLEPPAHRSTPARLRIRPTQSILMTRREPRSAFDCTDRFEVPLEVELELSELGQLLDASGALAIEIPFPNRGFVLLDVVGLGQCGVASSPEQDVVLTCSTSDGLRTALGSRRCLDAAEWQQVPSEVGEAGRSTLELVETASSAFPMQLACGCGKYCSDLPPADPAPESVTMHFSAVLPETYCAISEPYSADPTEGEAIPVLVRYALGDEPEHYVARNALLHADGIDIWPVTVRVNEAGAIHVSASTEWLIEDIGGNGHPWTCSAEVVYE